MSRSRRDLLATLTTAVGVGLGGCASPEQSEPEVTTGFDSTETVPTATSPAETSETQGLRTETRTASESTEARSETAERRSESSKSATTAPTSAKLRRVSVADVAAAPDGTDLSFAVEVVEQTVTTESTAVVRVSVTNEAADARQVGSGHRPAFSAVYSENQDPGLALLAPGSFYERPRDYERVASDCWRPDVTVSIAAVMEHVTLDPGETASVEVRVWGSPLNEGDCLPRGTYRFAESYEIENRTEPPVTTFEWDGFTLRVESP
ncbi:hypothetical protein [Halorussus sp. MSC15.2]|uniref:hypothetical protein n=1 Tax=Halorussus sp. MSC15.2 TaxID=2283638 RepID=UPI0013D84C41|nr:hypothetical protein [Halorussus sp. MSC15.2]NEU56853.1 hypothetical protein [Halorussus sp. MSC15.2]